MSHTRMVYEDKEISLDNAEFEDCTFINCSLEWNGGEYSLKGARFFGKTSFKTKNKEIADVISLMGMLGFLSQDFGKNWVRENN